MKHHVVLDRDITAPDYIMNTHVIDVMQWINFEKLWGLHDKEICGISDSMIYHTYMNKFIDSHLRILRSHNRIGPEKAPNQNHERE